LKLFRTKKNCSTIYLHKESSTVGSLGFIIKTDVLQTISIKYFNCFAFFRTKNALLKRLMQMRRRFINLFSEWRNEKSSKTFNANAPIEISRFEIAFHFNLKAKLNKKKPSFQKSFNYTWLPFQMIKSSN
jgi:hypothetical protein